VANGKAAILAEGLHDIKRRRNVVKGNKAALLITNSNSA
jgi:hypothetical protein